MTDHYEEIKAGRTIDSVLDDLAEARALLVKARRRAEAAEAALAEVQHRALAAEQERDALLTEQNQQRETIKDAVQTARNYYAMFHDETWKKRLTKWEAAIVKSEEGR